MTEEERNKILVRAIATYGEVSQINKAIEEMAELIKALCKFRGAEAPCEKDAAIGNIIEEMADVQIMLDQLKIIFKHDIEPMQRFKLQRLNKRIEWRVENRKSHAAFIEKLKADLSTELQTARKNSINKEGDPANGK